MTDITDVLISLYAESDAAVLSFMDYLFQDNCTYIFQILLLCTDKLSRTNTQKLISFIVNRCFEIEKDYLFETEVFEFDETVLNEDGTTENIK